MSDKYKILVVEDDAAINELLCNKLKKESFESVAYRSGQALLADCQLGVVADLMLLDYNLNDLDALQVIHKIKDLGCKIPFIICTGVGSETIAVNMMKEGAKDYLVKDQSFLKVLVPTINKVLAELNIEKQLAETRRKLTYQNAILSAVHELSLDGIVVVDSSDQVASVNQRFCQLWNEKSTLIGAKSIDVFHKISQKLTEPAKFLTSLSNVAATIAPTAKKHQDLELKSGEFYELYSTPMSTKGKPDFGRVWYFRDVTLEHQAQMKMAEARLAAENAAGLKAEFLANFSHEVKTPMNSLSGFLDLLSDSQLDDVQKDYLGLIKMSCQNLTKLINNTLDLSKLEAGAMGLDEQLFDIAQILNEAIIFVEANRKKVVSVHLEVPTGLAPVCGDSLRLQQVIVNLLSNALKFTDVGTVTLSCDKLTDSQYQFSVTDTGLGIEVDKQRQIFEAFRQTSNAIAKERGGTGLGLSISARIVRLLGGELKVESEPGKGSKFYFSVDFKPLDAI